MEGLGCLSYVVADEETGDAAVIDPQVTIDEYVEEAEAAGLSIRHVLDTHLHADHVSGNRALAAATGATVWLPADARAHFAHERLEEGSEVRLGNVLLRTRHTPGHTPEHVVLEVIDLSKGVEEPYAVLTGDTLFVGSVGRPDLVNTTGAEDLAGRLHNTLRNVLRPLPDGTLAYPGHGAGSACGASIGRALVTSLGFEKATNPYLEEMDRDAFIRKVATGLPPKPGNAAAIKRMNTDGPPTTAPDATAVPKLPPEAFAHVLGDGHGVLVLDLSEPDTFAANHVPGSLNVPLDTAAFPKRAAPFLEAELPLYLVLPDDGDLPRAVTGLARVGGIVRGVLEGGLYAWRNSGRPFGTLDTVPPHQAAAELGAGAARFLDVRTEAEWTEGHAAGAVRIPWDALGDRVDELDADARWIVACGSGYRSSIAASLLKRHGFPDVANLLGGMTAWEAARLPLETGAEPEVAPSRAI